MAQTVHAEGNFLIPNATFIAELVAFILILLVIWRYIVPPIQKAIVASSPLINISGLVFHSFAPGPMKYNITTMPPMMCSAWRPVIVK